MVSERQLTRKKSHFWWSSWTPALSESWLVGMLRNQPPASGRVFNWEQPLNSNLAPRDHDLVSETAFGLFATAADMTVSIEELTQEQIDTCVRRATDRIMLLRGTGRDLTGVMTSAHIAFAAILAQRLLAWTMMQKGTIEVQPKLPGIGIVDGCHADLIIGDQLIEVKMARAPFKLSDIRQILIYAALAWLGTDRHLRHLVLINPMLGLTWDFDLLPLAGELAGQGPSQFFENFDKLSRGEHPLT